MVKIEIKPEYLNFESTKDGDIVEITASGSYIEETGQFGKNKGKQIMRFYLPVKNGTIELMWTPWDSEIKQMVEGFGSDETDDWVGKKVEILHIDKKMKIRPVKVQKV